MAARATPAKLRAYAAKRDFGSTPEPPPRREAIRKSAKSARKLSFCVQKHLASALHYDFRLEHDGVLLSWAVPKGPSLNPEEKRMAIRTEDHPLAYRTFEGVIPSGYGAGVVMLWDQGTWKSESPDVAAAIEKGELKFSLEGVKLKGSWVLVRTRYQAGERQQWLLIKHRDDWAGDVDVTSAAPDSVKTFNDFSTIVAADKNRDALAQFAADSKGKGEAAMLLREVVATAAQQASTPPAPKSKQMKTDGPKTKNQNVAAPPPPNEPKLTNRDKVLYPATDFTKGNLVDYYRRVAPLILPHLRGRAVTLKRFPDGVNGKSFFEKRCASHRPSWVKTARVALSEHTIDFCLIEDVPTLLWAANLAAIELHVPLALAKTPDRPTSMVFDLDPGAPASIADCVRTALRLRELLAGVGLKCLVKTSGSKGLHVIVPLNTPHVTFDDTKAFARATALTLQRDDPEHVIASMTRSARTGKVFIDWSQNDRAKTTVCVYSVRAQEQPFISTPFDWSQLQEHQTLASGTARDPVKRNDRFAAALSWKQRLPNL